MNKNLLIVLFLIFCISCKNLAIKNTKKISLFNGENLNGWTIEGKEKWYVEDNLLVCETVSKKDFGYLISNKKYKNFELNLEFKHETIGNSGVFLHVDYNNNDTIKGWQVEIGPPGHKTAGIHKYDKGWLSIPDASKDSVLRMGEWNSMKIQVHNSMLITWLNGIKMASTIDPELHTTSGYIALQIRDKNAKIKWRAIEIITY